MKKMILFTFLLISILGFSQEKKVYRVYLKDNTTLDIVNPVKVLNNVNYTTLEGNSGTIENNKYYTIRAVSKSNFENYTPVKFTYCELVGYDNRKIFDFKVHPTLNVMVDYGESDNEFESGYIIDEKSGKAKLFSSMVEAMNFMGQNGWEFVQAYTISEQSGGQVYRWLLKRSIK